MSQLYKGHTKHFTPGTPKKTPFPVNMIYKSLQNFFFPLRFKQLNLPNSQNRTSINDPLNLKFPLFTTVINTVTQLRDKILHILSNSQTGSEITRSLTELMKFAFTQRVFRKTLLLSLLQEQHAEQHRPHIFSNPSLLQVRTENLWKNPISAYLQWPSTGFSNNNKTTPGI